MSTERTTVVADLKAPDQPCPHCGNPFTAVEYYTGTMVSRDSERLSAQTLRIETVYRDVAHHVGGLCRHCIKYNRKQKAKRWLIVGALGLVFLVVCALMVRESLQYRDELLMKVAMGVGIFGLSVLLLGLVAALCLSSYNPMSKLPYINLYALFMQRLDKEHWKRKNLTYMTEDSGRALLPHVSPDA